MTERVQRRPRARLGMCWASALAALAAAPPAAASPAVKGYAAVLLEEAYDSNVLSSGQGDVVTRVDPQVGLLRDGPRLDLGADYTLALHAYALGRADNSINHRAAGFVQAAFTRRLLGGARLRFLRADDPALIDRPSVLLSEVQLTDVTAGADLAYRATRRLTLDAAYAYRNSRFDATAESSAVNGDEHDGRLGAAYRLTRRLDGGVLARAQRFGTSDAEAASAMGGGVALAWRATRLLRLRAEGGPLYYAPDGVVTWFARAQAFWVRRRDRLHARAGREIVGGTGADRAVWVTHVEADGSRRLTRRLTVTGMVWLARSGAAPNGAADVSSLAARGELYWQIGRNLLIGAYAEQRAQDATGALGFGDVHRTLVGLRLTAVAGIDTDRLLEVP